MSTPSRSAVRCMPSFAKTARARARASTRFLPKKPRPRRRSRCTRISAEVRDSAALIASVIAPRSVSLRNRRAHFGGLAIRYQSPLAPPPPDAPPPPEKPPSAPPPPKPPPPQKTGGDADQRPPRPAEYPPR